MDTVYPSLPDDAEQSDIEMSKEDRQAAVDEKLFGDVIFEEDSTTTMQTKAAAAKISEMLGYEISEQSLRNYTSDYWDYLGMERKATNNAALYTMESIRRLARILEIKNARNFKKSSMLEFLSSSPMNQMLIMGDDERWSKMMEMASAQASEIVVKQMSMVMEQYMKQLGDRINEGLDRIEQKQEDSSSALLKEKEKELQETKEELARILKNNDEKWEKDEKVIENYKIACEEALNKQRELEKELEEERARKRPIFGWRKR